MKALAPALFLAAALVAPPLANAQSRHYDSGRGYSGHGRRPPAHGYYRGPSQGYYGYRYSRPHHYYRPHYGGYYGGYYAAPYYEYGYAPYYEPYGYGYYPPPPPPRYYPPRPRARFGIWFGF